MNIFRATILLVGLWWAATAYAGPITMTPDLTAGGTSENTILIDVSDAEAFLVRKNADGGDVLVVNTSAASVGIGDGAGTLTGKLEIGGDADQPQLVIEAHSSQADSVLIVQADNDTEGFTVEGGGLVSSLVGYDCIGAVDCDIGSADVTDVTVVTDGGSVVIDGSITIPGDMYASAGSTVGSLGAAGDGTFHIHTASAGNVTADGGADDLVVENSTEVGISLLSPHDETSSIFFGSIDSNDDPVTDTARDARIHWRFSDSTLTVGTNTVGGLLNFKTNGGTVNLILAADGLATFSQDVSVGDLSAVGSDPLCWDGSGASLIGDCTSLSQWKNNQIDLTIGLAEILKLRPREFDWDEQHGAGRHDLGFVAEEVAAVNPLLATYRPGLTGVKYSRMTSLLVKGMQEQQAQIEKLTARISELEQQLR